MQLLQPDNEDLSLTRAVYQVAPPYTSGNIHCGHILEVCHWATLGRLRQIYTLLGERQYLRDSEIRALERLRARPEPLLLWGIDTNGSPIVKRVLEQTPDIRDRTQLYQLCGRYVDANEELVKRTYTEWGLLEPFKFVSYYSTGTDSRLHTLLSLFLKKAKERGLIERKRHPSYYCLGCKTTIGAVEKNLRVIEGYHYYFKAYDEEGNPYEIMTTKPEGVTRVKLITYAQGDSRYMHLEDKFLGITLSDGTVRRVRVRHSKNVSRNKGTGLVYVAAYGSDTDIEILREHQIDVTEEDNLYDDEGLPTTSALIMPIELRKESGKIIEMYHSQRLNCKGIVVINSPVGLVVGLDSATREGVLARAKSLVRVGPMSGERSPDIAPLEELVRCFRGWCISRDPDRYYSVKLPGYPEFVADTWLISSLISSMPRGRVNRFMGVQITSTWLFYTLLVEEIMGTRPGLASVQLHGLILDQRGRKISKSLSNGPNLEEMIANYPKFALRCSILSKNYSKNFKYNPLQIKKWQALGLKIRSLLRWIALETDEVSHEPPQGYQERVSLEQIVDNLVGFEEGKVLPPSHSLILGNLLMEVYKISRSWARSNRIQVKRYLNYRIRLLSLVFSIYE